MAYSNAPADTWLLLKGVALTLFVGMVAHRLVWIALDKVDSRNNFRGVYTKKSQTNTVDLIEAYLNSKGFFTDKLYGSEKKAQGELFTQSHFSLLWFNPFEGTYTHNTHADSRGLRAGRGLDEVPVIGPIFHFFSESTWYTGDFCIWLFVYISVYGLDDDCTFVKIRFENVSSPPIFNIWGPSTRAQLFNGIKKAIKATDSPSREPGQDMDETDVADIDVDDSADYRMPPIPYDIDELERLWAKAGTGDPHAQFIVGSAFRDGIGYERDYEKAFKCFEFAARSNHPEALYALARFYRDGVIVQADREKYEKLVELSAKVGFPQAMYEFGCFEERRMMISDAYEWWEKAANRGHTPAMLKVADVLFRYGDAPDLIKRNDARSAEHWLREAAGRGDTDAICKLGSLRHKEGKHDAAMRQYRRAALGGHSGAQMEVGYRYLYGLDTRHNLMRARHWLREAAAQGEEDAAQHLQIAEVKLIEAGM